MLATHRLLATKFRSAMGEPCSRHQAETAVSSPPPGHTQNTAVVDGRPEVCPARNSHEVWALRCLARNFSGPRFGRCSGVPAPDLTPSSEAPTRYPPEAWPRLGQTLSRSSQLWAMLAIFGQLQLCSKQAPSRFAMPSSSRLVSSFSLLFVRSPLLRRLS